MDEIKKLFVIFCLMGGCGGGETEKETKIIERPVPKPPDTSKPGDDIVTFEDIAPVLKANCALSGCHAGASFLANERAFASSNSKQRVGNGSMPPKYSPKYDQWGRDEKEAVLQFFDGQ